MTNAENTAYPVKGLGPHYMGLTKRELFAAMAMQGLLNTHTEFTTIYTYATDAVRLADALISELNKTEQNESENL